MSDCGHSEVITYSNAEVGSKMWACANCHRRFYPACETCVDVGHRNESHVPMTSNVMTCPHGAEWDGRIWTKVSVVAQPDEAREWCALTLGCMLPPHEPNRPPCITEGPHGERRPEQAV